MESLTRDDALRIIQALRELHDRIGQFLNESGQRPSADSRAATELRTYQCPKSLETAYDQGSMLVEAAADQLMAFTRTVSEPTQTIAPWTCVRAVVESSALAAWLLDPTIEARERVERSFALRYEGLSQRVKFARVALNESEFTKATERIDQVERVAISLGFLRVENRKGKRIGIAQHMPSVTRIIAQTLDKEATYRLLSAVTHAHHWALLQTSYCRVEGRETYHTEDSPERASLHLLKKSLSPMGVAFLSKEGMCAFSTPVRHWCTLFGWDAGQLDRILDSASIAMGFDARITARERSAGC